MAGTFVNTLKFNVKDCDPNTGEPDVDVGYPDEYLVSSKSERLYIYQLFSELSENEICVCFF